MRISAASLLGGRIEAGSNLFSRSRLEGGWPALGRARFAGGGGERLAGETLGADSEVMAEESGRCWNGGRSFLR